MGTQQALIIASDLCREYEGLHKVQLDGLVYPYICPAGYPTQGFGTVFRPDGLKVTMGDAPIIKETALDWLMTDLERVYMAGVLKASPGLVAHPKSLAAITSFAYNLGVPRYRASTLRKRVDAQDWAGAKAEMMKWVRGGGRVLPGLVKRRAAEAALLGS